MGRQLLDREPIFRQAVEECDALLQPLAGWSLLKEMRAEERSRIHEACVAQPAILALQVGLVASGGPGASIPQRSSGTASARRLRLIRRGPSRSPTP